MREDDEAARRLLPVADAVAAAHEDGRLYGSGVDAADEVRWLGLQLREAAPGHRYGWLAPLIELALRPNAGERPTASEFADYLRARVAPPEPARRRSPALFVLAGAAVVAVFGVLGATLLLTGGGDDDSPVAARSEPERTAEEEEQPTATRSAEPVSARELERFAREYVATASSDPEQGFRLLTRSYQGLSPRYHEVWQAIEDPEILALRAQPETLTVHYTYRYRIAGARRTEDVTLQLVRRGGRLLIAGATARLR